MTHKYSVEPNGSHWVISYETDDGENGYVCSVAEQIVAYTFAAAFQMKDALEEMVADAETMNPPYRNEAICERANAALHEARSQSHDRDADGNVRPLEAVEEVTQG